MADAHLTGIGGVGMSALAQAMLDRGLCVSGSDRMFDRDNTSDTFERLRSQGVRLHRQDGSGAAKARRVVLSSAIENDNPDRAAALSRNIPVVGRAEALAGLIPEGAALIAVSGTCGKSTTTALLGWLLAEAGHNPTVVNGAGVPPWGSHDRIASVRKGADAFWVIEADESDRSLTVFRPRHAIVTNASADHFPETEARALFARFCALTSGMVIDGTAPDAPQPDWRDGDWGGVLRWENREYALPMPGRHNAYNALQALRMALALGVVPETAAAALATFPGVERRLQRIGVCGKAVVVDDFAHNPEKLAAVWTTLADRFSRVAAVWRPHGFGPLSLMFEALEATFTRVCRSVDRLFVLPVYDAGGTANRCVSSSVLVDRLRRRGVPCEALTDIGNAESALRSLSAPATVLAILGARDPELPRLARRLVDSWDASATKPDHR